MKFIDILNEALYGDVEDVFMGNNKKRIKEIYTKVMNAKTIDDISNIDSYLDDAIELHEKSLKEIKDEFKFLAKEYEII